MSYLLTSFEVLWLFATETSTFLDFGPYFNEEVFDLLDFASMLE